MSDIEDEETCEATFTFRLTKREREGLDWIAGERTREVRDASGLRDIRRTAADSLRELIRADLERRNWPGPEPASKSKPASGRRKAS